MITTKKVVVLLGFVLAFVSPCIAQKDTLPDSKGKDFWFCFLPNFHNGSRGQTEDGIDDPEIQRRDSLYIFVASEKPTNVTLQYADSSGQVKTRTFSITDPKKVLSIGEQFYPYELIGFNRCGQRIDQTGGQNLRIANQYFHLWSDEDVTVYAMDQAFRTSDAFLVLPTDALGNSYYVLSYYSDPSSATQNTPSQFAIVATEDSTVVRFEAPRPGLIFRYGNLPPSITLNKGQVYLVQSNTGSYGDPPDLTGTKIVSTKPIALFSGHQRALLPIQSHNSLTSRDCLIEQLTPIATWGHSALLVPYPEPVGSVVTSGDKYRILAAYDSTEVWIDSVFNRLLYAGEWMEGDLRTAHSVFCTRAVEIAQYKHTGTPNSAPDNFVYNGDPFMMVIPPSNQFLKSYRFVNVQASENTSGVGNTTTYKEQWLTVILPTTSIPSLLVDSKPWSSGFVPIPKSEYSYAWIRMTDGVHTVSADTGVGILVYGYGGANSYGYVGGMAYKRYDFNAPQILGTPMCYEINGGAFDTTLADTKLVMFRLVKDSIKNVNLSIDPFIPPSDSIHYHASLVDPYSDGYFVLEARDVEGYLTRQRFDLPGYTLRIVDKDSSLKIDRTENVKNGPDRTYCRDYIFLNNGTFTHTIKNLRSSNPASTISTDKPLPLELKANDTLRFSVCYRYHDFGDYNETIFMDEGCPERPIVFLSIGIGIDTVQPSIAAIPGSCGDLKSYVISDVGDYQTGLMATKVIDTTNCTVTTDFDPDSSVIRVAINDWRLDAWFGLEVSDSTGNKRTIVDTIPGFTVMYTNVDSLRPELRLADTHFRIAVCDTIELFNYGRFTKSYASLPLSQNTRFSFPQHQLPLTLQPGESRRVAICNYLNEYPATSDSLWRDTLILSEDCHVRPLYLSAAVLVSEYVGQTRCNVPITSRSIPGGSSFVYSIYPQPASSQLSIMVHLEQAEQLRVEAVNQIGLSHEMLDFHSGRGDYVVPVDVSALRSGVYTIVVRSGGQVISTSTQIITH